VHRVNRRLRLRASSRSHASRHVLTLVPAGLRAVCCPRLRADRRVRASSGFRGTLVRRRARPRARDGNSAPRSRPGGA
jgi:hypothetical protein